MLFFALVIRSLHHHVHTRLATSPKYHPVLAGLTLAGTYLLLFILSMDCAALYYYGQHKHEYSNEEVDGEFNLFILGITFGLDVLVSVLHLMCMLYLSYTQMREDGCCKLKCCLEKVIPICIIPYFYAIFGSKKQKKIWSVDGPNIITRVWVVTGIMVAPLFALASHAGYILIAWVTDPVTTTASIFIGLGSFIYLFFVFRQCYTTYTPYKMLTKPIEGYSDNSNAAQEIVTECNS